MGDRPVVRRLVRLACGSAPDLQVVGEAANGGPAIELCRRLTPDVVVLDIGGGEGKGLGLARALKADGSTTRLLILSGHTDPETALQALRAGVDGYLDETASAAEIVPAVRAVASGQLAFSVSLQQVAASGIGRLAERSRRASGWLTRLTPREREILGLIARGRSTRDVAAHLYLSELTVRTHLADLYRKLDVSGRVAAVRRAAELGLVDMDETPSMPPLHGMSRNPQLTGTFVRKTGPVTTAD